MIEIPGLPAPPVDAGLFRPFWEAAAAGHLAIPRCPDCSRWAWYPAARCLDCGRQGLAWTPVEGRGTLFTFTVVHRSFFPAHARLGEPYAVGLIELSDAAPVRLVGLVTGVPPAQVKIGMRLGVSFEEVAGHRLPVWRPC
jgi:uncharacterized protein